MVLKFEVVGSDEDTAVERLDEQDPGQFRRLVRLKIAMSPPSVTEVDCSR